MATLVIPNVEQMVTRVYANRESIGATLLDMDGEVIDLTGKTIQFRLVRLPSGNVEVNNTSATIDSAADGQVSYTPVADYPVGEYAIYFLDATSSPTKRFPYDGAKFILRVIPETKE